MSESTTPRERRHERTREAILTAARELIALHGAENVSLRAIARKIDYSPAGLYEYFGSKEEIINALRARANSQLGSYLRRVSEDLPLEAYMVDLLEAYIDFARHNPEMYTIMFLQSAISVSEVPTQFDPNDSFTILINAVQRGVDEGTYATTNEYSVFDIAYSLWAMAHGMAMLQARYMRDFRYDFARADREAVKTFVTGLQHRAKTDV